MADEPEVDEELIQCWCGAKGTYEDLFDESVFDHSCGGSGILHCECGGDLCVCHNHGEVECPGCPDCEMGDDSDGGCFDEDFIGWDNEQ